MSVPTTYFPVPGPENTGPAADAGLARLSVLGLTDIVLASNTGFTAKEVLRRLRSADIAVAGGEASTVAAAGGSDRAARLVNVVVVTHHVGFREPGGDEMDQTTRAELAQAGARLLTTTHLLGGVERGVSRQFGGLYPGGLIAGTLRLFGEGTKVAVEIAVMALDAGLIPYGRDVLSLGGSGRGADTALVVRPAHSSSFFDTRVVEVVCRPLAKR